MPETKSIRGVEIFAAGRWNGDDYTEQDMDAIVQSFEETKAKLRPYLKLGHGKKQTLIEKDELPSAGFIDRVYRVGKKLVADFSNIPDKIYELIKRRAYDRVSSEIFVNMKIGDKTYPYALKAVALLGGETPAVQDLNSILNLYQNDYESISFSSVQGCEVTTSDLNTKTESQEDAMSANIEEVVRQNTKLEAQVKSLESEIAELEKENKAMEQNFKATQSQAKEYKEKAESLEKNLKEFEHKAFEKEVDMEVEKLFSDGKIVPAQKPFLSAILKGVKMNESTKSFSIEGKEYADVKTLVKAFIDAHVEIKTDEQVETDHIVDSKTEEAHLEKVHKYAQEHKVSFKEAYLRLAPKNLTKDEK